MGKLKQYYISHIYTEKNYMKVKAHLKITLNTITQQKAT